jgi:hypothetical protein
LVVAVVLTLRLTFGATEPVAQVAANEKTASGSPTPISAAGSHPVATSPSGPDASVSRATPSVPEARNPLPRRLVPEQGSGRFTVADGRSDAVGHGELVTYSVEVEAGVAIGPEALARIIEKVLGDPRGWTGVSGRSLQRVAMDPDFRIRLATPGTTDALCSPLETGGRLSCRNGEYVVLNAWRWENGATSYDGEIADYRRYMINHEFGHALGYGHRACPHAGAPAPVMVQQTKGLEGCIANPWPAVTNG